jgi:hypothetical protein
VAVVKKVEIFGEVAEVSLVWREALLQRAVEVLYKHWGAHCLQTGAAQAAIVKDHLS